MPIYEYQCKKCGKKFEVFQGITDGEIKNCKFCDGTVSKLISLTSFHLKGSGWYVTDYGGKKPSVSEAPNNDSSSTSSETASVPDPKPSSEKSE